MNNVSPCVDCAQASANAAWGGVDFNCATCCARLVRSARPMRHAQEAFLAAMLRLEAGPTKDQILEAIAEMDQEQKERADNE